MRRYIGRPRLAALAELEEHTLAPVLSHDERKLEERVGE